MNFNNVMLHILPLMKMHFYRFQEYILLMVKCYENSKHPTEGNLYESLEGKLVIFLYKWEIWNAYNKCL